MKTGIPKMTSHSKLTLEDFRAIHRAARKQYLIALQEVAGKNHGLPDILSPMILRIGAVSADTAFGGESSPKE